jgi:uncharacterized membrane protein
MYWITGILGAAFVLAPFLFGYSENSIALWTSLILGGAVMVVSYLEAAALDSDRWEYWVATITGIAAMVAPFALGFRSLPSAFWTSIAIGLLLAIVAGYRLYSDQMHYE